MSATISFVARDELARWLESRADTEMKSVSAVCQDIVAAEYRRQNPVDRGKWEQAQADKGGSSTDSLESERTFQFASKREADSVRTQFEEHLSGNDDGRLKNVTFDEGTPGEIVNELNRRSRD